MTAKEQAIKALEKANANYSDSSYAIQTKAAILYFLFDELGIKDIETMKECFARFMECPSWFGASANCMTDSGVIEKVAKKDRVVPEFKEPKAEGKK